MSLLQYVKDKQLKKQVPVIKPGYIVAVHQIIREGKKERVQVFKGIVIKTKGGKGVDSSFTVRRIASGVGVEKTFLINSPLLEKVVVLKIAQVRRAKLYYLRGRFGKAANLILSDESGKDVENLVREVVGEEEVITNKEQGTTEEKVDDKKENVKKEEKSS